MKTYLITKDHFNTQEEFELRYDQNLDMLITHPQPMDLSSYYKSEAYISHSDNSKTLLSKIYQIVKSYSIFKKINLINKFPSPNKTLLDIGAGTADFLLASQKKNWKIQGVEPNTLAQKNATLKGVTLHPDLSQIKTTFDVITLWHVLEHLPDLQDQIQKIHALLNPEGRLIIAVPNYKSYDAQKYKTHWAAYDVPRHLWHFSKESISKLFINHDFIVTNTYPMYFDSYYVSLLSEKYKHGKNNYLSALWTGFLSNLKAQRSGEFSSLIYVIKKN